MAGLVSAIHVFLREAVKTWMPAMEASEATPFFERLREGMAIGRHFGIIHGIRILRRLTWTPRFAARR